MLSSTRVEEGQSFSAAQTHTRSPTVAAPWRETGPHGSAPSETHSSFSRSSTLTESVKEPPEPLAPGSQPPQTTISSWPECVCEAAAAYMALCGAAPDVWISDHSPFPYAYNVSTACLFSSRPPHKRTRPSAVVVDAEPESLGPVPSAVQRGASACAKATRLQKINCMASVEC